MRWVKEIQSHHRYTVRTNTTRNKEHEMKDTYATWKQADKILDSPALSRARAIVILKDGEVKGTIRVAYPKGGAGTLRVVLHESGFDPQIGSASGYGYDKLSAALRGMVFGGIELQDHPHNWETQLRKAGYTVFTVL